jgi:hypothetical protein
MVQRLHAGVAALSTMDATVRSSRAAREPMLRPTCARSSGAERLQAPEAHW